MSRHILAAGLAAIATVATIATSPEASAATLSRKASSLLRMDAGTGAYESEYNNVSALYQNQQTNHSLAFDDWFAINSFVNDERAAYGGQNAKLQELTALNVDDLTWEAGAHDVEVFFINEGAGYWNKFGYSTVNPSEALGEDPAGREPLREFWGEHVNVIWNGIASRNSILPNGGNMSLGEGYKIGDVAAGDTVNFFLRNPRNNVFDSGSVATTYNADRLQHVTTYQYKDYLVLAYEDLYNGGDRDYNDVVIAVKGLTDTSAASVPEPASVLALASLGIVGIVIKRKQNNVLS